MKLSTALPIPALRNFVRSFEQSFETKVRSLQAEVDRLQAEQQGRLYAPDGSSASELQAMIFAQRHAERAARLENYRQKIDSAKSKLAQTLTDIAAYTEQYARGAVRTVSADSFAAPSSTRGPSTPPNSSDRDPQTNTTFYRAKISLDEMRLRNLPPQDFV